MKTIVTDLGKIKLNSRLQNVPILRVLEQIVSEFYDLHPVCYEDLRTDPQEHYSEDVPNRRFT